MLIDWMVEHPDIRIQIPAGTSPQDMFSYVSLLGHPIALIGRSLCSGPQPHDLVQRGR